VNIKDKFAAAIHDDSEKAVKAALRYQYQSVKSRIEAKRVIKVPKSMRSAPFLAAF
jgi:hypothetical protein